ncbi:small, acid-soluble spore protein K [Fictibacillus macauensis ZFHKF-1]|uniref:Small, acid-soluble spore protein K n=1 Tax=Fictibacillus macauensis ZFHKF-1 TaxID=1196324 RepID=I8AG80_9BACL|nr:small, acid-soluble spore protein K [Fictibacillus macauensis]EIT84672.1 small, acid-soluble spore protein K [Fictibacillus macauensis ZFHKF-1]
MRNKASNFPHRISFSGEPRAKEEHSSKRSDGSIRDRPQERMFSSNRHRDDTH